MKKSFTVIEIIIVFLLILAAAFFMVPKSFENTRQAKNIEAWSEYYAKVQYMFSAIAAQKDEKLIKQFDDAKTNELRGEMLLELIKPYMRTGSGVEQSSYKPYYMNNMPVMDGQLYSFNNLYSTSDNKIFGLKWLNNDSKDGTYAVMMLDINGIEPPNMWGKDIFGINITLENIEPFGNSSDINAVKSDCSSRGSGVMCSYYYIWGGGDVD